MRACQWEQALPREAVLAAAQGPAPTLGWSPHALPGEPVASHTPHSKAPLGAFLPGLLSAEAPEGTVLVACSSALSWWPSLQGQGLRRSRLWPAVSTDGSSWTIHCNLSLLHRKLSAFQVAEGFVLLVCSVCF